MARVTCPGSIKDGLDYTPCYHCYPATECSHSPSEIGEHWAVTQEEKENPESLPGCFTLLAIVFAFLLLGIASVSAQDRPIPTLGTEGAAGMWLPLEDFRLALQDREAIPRYVEQIRLLSESLSLAHTEIDQRVTAQAATDLNVVNLGQSIEVLIAQVSDATQRAQAAERDRDAWYRSPFLWVVIGFVVGVVGVSLIYVGVSS